MQKAIIGKKLGMTQVFSPEGKLIPVTVIEAGPCTVVQKKTVEKDGYEAIQVGFGEVNPKRVSKPLAGHFNKAGVPFKKTLKEFRLEDISGYEVASEIKCDVFAEGEKVDVTGVNKGKGYAGVIKRHGFARLKETHGTGPVHRHPGSMGACSTPSRVMKGKKLPGHMGHKQVTVLNLDVVKVDSDRNLILVKGAVPGPKGAVVSVRNTVK